MADTGWISPGSADQTGSGDAFDVPSNVFTSNNSYAFKDINNLTDTTTLRAYNFSAGIPSGAIIDGVQVRVEWRGEDNDIDDIGVELLSTSRTPVGDNKALTNALPAADTYWTYGGASDTWGLGLTEAWINDTDFGFGIELFNSDVISNRQAYVDHMQIKVYYTPVADTTAMVIRIG